MSSIFAEDPTVNFEDYVPLGQRKFLKKIVFSH